MIIYRITEDNGFLCGCTERRIAAYAYPTSEHAEQAKRNPAKVAAEMMAAEFRAPGTDLTHIRRFVKERDERWLADLQAHWFPALEGQQ